MRVIKSINNNVAHCLDSKGREVIVFGKGIGFFKSEEDIPLNRINRTFYNVKDTDFGVLRTIPTVVINTAIYIIDMVSDELNITYPSSTAISLADHLQFAIERKEQNIYLPQPIIQDIRQLYPAEMEMALKSLKIIEKMTGVKLPRQEAGTIAMHLINDRLNVVDKSQVNTVELTEKCTRIIERFFDIRIDRESFNYSRFVIHLDYLIRRLMDDYQIESENKNLCEEMKTSYPDAFNCAEKICNFLSTYLSKYIYDEEVLYLAIHINRLLSRI